MEDVTTLISALAWPVTVLILVFFFRREFRFAASRLSTLKYKDFQADFERDLVRLEGEVKSLPPTHTSNDVQPSTKQTQSELSNYQQLLRIAEISPRAAITEAWRDIELATKAATDAYGISVGGQIAGVKAIRALVQQGLLPEDVIRVYERMRVLRSKAAHANDFLIDQEEAERYIETAQEFLKRITGLVEGVKESN